MLDFPSAITNYRKNRFGTVGRSVIEITGRKESQRRASDGRRKGREKLDGLRVLSWFVSGFIIMRTWLVARKMDWKMKIVPDR